jgi:ubiquinone/menaquinone biosynthesis C-methylase UbiE
LEQVRRSYRGVADRYTALFGSTAQMHADDLALIVRQLSIPSGLVLDVGCGPGHLTAHLRLLGVDAAGVDLVPEFIDHARAAHPECRFDVGSMLELEAPDHSVAGILAWYSLIHLPPEDLDDALAELHRVIVPGGTVVVGFFDGDEFAAFDHQVVTAYSWPVDDLSARLSQAGFMEIERETRPGVDEPGRRPHAALISRAT